MELNPDLPNYPGLHILYRSGSLALSPEEVTAATRELAAEFNSIMNQAGQMGSAGRIFKDRSLLESLLGNAQQTPGEILLIHCTDHAIALDLRAKFPAAKVHEVPESTHLFFAHGLENSIDRLRSRVVALSGGGSLVIEETEALVSIDVNSGSAQTKGRRDGIYELMKKHGESIGGSPPAESVRIIIIDFISMKRENDRIRLYEKAIELTKGRTPLTKVYPITELGLMQIARRRQGESLSRTLFASDHQKKLPVSASYLYKLIRIRLDDPNLSMKSFLIAANPIYTYELKAIQTLLAEDYPDFTFRIETSFDTDTVKVSPVLF